MADGQWTPLMVEERLAEAADVLKRLPPVKVQGYYSLWPRYIYEFADLVGQEPPQLRLPPPSAASITRMDEAMEWLKWLEADDARLAWARAANKPWKELCWEFGMSRAAAWRRWVMALCIVAMNLNGERVPNGRAQLEQVALRKRRFRN
jgi:hypothetical protein